MDSVDWVAVVFGASPYFCDLYLQESYQGVLVTEDQRKIATPSSLWQ